MLKYKTAPKSTIKLNRLEDLSIEELYSYIDKYNYVCIKGLFDVSKLKHSIAKLRSLYSANNDNPSIGEERHEIRDNFQKLPRHYNRSKKRKPISRWIFKRRKLHWFRFICIKIYDKQNNLSK